VDDLAAELARPTGADGASQVRGSLAEGGAGLALFFAALAEANPCSPAGETALRWLDRAIDEASTGPFHPGFYEGSVGISWVLSLLEGTLLRPDDEPSDVDVALAGLLEADGPWPLGHDLIRGLVGAGVYALGRLSQAGGPGLLAAVVKRLAGSAEAQRDGLTWWTAPDPTTTVRTARYPHGHYDLGLAHGQAGVVAVLAAAAAAGTTGALSLLHPALAWLRAQRLPVDAGAGFYPAIVGPGEEPAGGRLAWCYGDPSVAVALLAAGHATGDPGLVAEAVEVALSFQHRTAPTGLMDAGLCHGRSGLAHLFNRLAQATGDRRLFGAARSFLDATLEHRRPGTAVAGFPAYLPSAVTGGDPAFVPRAGLLEGAAGVALALLATATPIEPAWDGALLLRPVTAWTRP
jgi:class I lanthipeptide synthase